MSDPQTRPPIDLRLPVDDHTVIAATVFLPDPATLGARPVCLFALPGGGYGRGYYDLAFAGRTGFSQARYHQMQGLIFVAIDHLGVGDSTVADLATMRIEDIARANDAAVRLILQRLAAGSLAEDFPPLPSVFKVGIGQSMGGGVTIIMQGRHATYDAIACLGYSAIHTVLPQRSVEDQQASLQAAGHQAGRDADPGQLSLEISSRAIPDFVYPFHWDDVPADIVQADMGGGFPIRAVNPPWGSRTVPNCVIAMMSPGYVKAEAAAVSVPVLIGAGERDTLPDPWTEPSAFRASGDVTVLVVPRMAHMHNFAGPRQRLWQRLAGWARQQADGADDAASR